MKLKIVKEFEKLVDIEKSWKKLEEDSKEITFYSTYDFIKEWTRINNNIELFTIIVEEGGKIIGIAPLCIEKRRKKFLQYRVLKFLGRGDFLNFIVQEESRQTIIKKIFEEIEKNSEKWDKIELTHIPENSNLLWYLNKSQKYKNSVSYLEECPYIEINKIDDMDMFLSQYGPSKIKWYKNKLDKEIGYKLEVICGGGNEVVETMANIHRIEQEYLRNHKLRQERESLFQDINKMELVKRVYEKEGQVYTFFLKTKEGKVMSYSSCYFYKDKLHLWNTGYLPSFNKYSVSKLSYYEIIKYCYENHICLNLDLGAVGYPWKFEWTNKSIKIYSFEKWNRNSYIYKIKKISGRG